MCLSVFLSVCSACLANKRVHNLLIYQPQRDGRQARKCRIMYRNGEKSQHMVPRNENSCDASSNLFRPRGGSLSTSAVRIWYTPTPRDGSGVSSVSHSEAAPVVSSAVGSHRWNSLQSWLHLHNHNICTNIYIYIYIYTCIYNRLLKSHVSNRTMHNTSNKIRYKSQYSNKTTLKSIVE